jgi:hypothetical protein
LLLFRQDGQQASESVNALNAGPLLAAPHAQMSLLKLYLAANATMATPHRFAGNDALVSAAEATSDIAPAAVFPEDALDDLQNFCQDAGKWMNKCNQGIKVAGRKIGTICQVAHFSTSGITKMIQESTKLCSCLDKMSAAVAAVKDLFDADSKGSFDNFKMSAMKAVSKAATCMLQQGWRIQNNKEVSAYIAVQVLYAILG